MTGSEPHAGRRAELYVRSLSPSGCRRPQSAVVERLAALEADDVVDEFDVHVWGKQAPASPAEAKTDAGIHALERVTAFREWARQNDVSLDAAFEVRSVEADARDGQYRSIRFPTFLLAEHRDGELACVTPHENRNEVRTVADRLARLDRGVETPYQSLDGPRYSAGTPARVEPDPERLAPE